jgi:hypothetical protein
MTDVPGAAVDVSALGSLPMPVLAERGALEATATNPCSSAASRGGDAAVAQALTAPMTHTKPKPCRNARRRPFISLSRMWGKRHHRCRVCEIRRVEPVAEPSARERTERRSHEHFSCASEKNVRCRHARRCDARIGAHVPLAGLQHSHVAECLDAKERHHSTGRRVREPGTAERPLVRHGVPAAHPTVPGAPSIQPERGGPVRGSPRIFGPRSGQTERTTSTDRRPFTLLLGPHARRLLLPSAPVFPKAPFFGQARF